MVVPERTASVVVNGNSIFPTLKMKTPGGYVGFGNYSKQVHRSAVKKGFYFTLMVVGESGLGKSTLVNTLFNTTLYPEKSNVTPSKDIPKTVEIQSMSADIEEAGVKLTLTVIDTPGFGDFVNNEDSWKPIIDNIDHRYNAYLDQESRVNRSKVIDNRVHACLYFIAPTGHSLKPLDIEFMKRLHNKVNLIPVIAKSDTLTEDEVGIFKERILNDITFNNIQIFKPVIHELDDPAVKAEVKDISSKIPFAIVGGTELQDVDGRKVRGRKYPWGVIEVDNEDHSDFTKLRQMIIRTNMEELKDVTNQDLYEKFRSEKLLSVGAIQDTLASKEVNPVTKMEEERSLHEAKMQKMESEMKMVFQQKVQEKEQKLKNSEDELYARHKELKEALDKQRQELEEKKKRLEGSVRSESDDKGKKKGFPFKQ